MYSEKVMDHFSNPRNVGEIENASGTGTVGNAKCGDIMKMDIQVENGVIVDVKFKTFGCGAAIATSSMATEMVKGKTIEEAEREFDGMGYGDFKTAVGQVCCDKLIPVQEEYRRILADKAYLEEVMKKGADEASYYARKTLSKVRRKLGFVNL